MSALVRPSLSVLLAAAVVVAVVLTGCFDFDKAFDDCAQTPRCHVAPGGGGETDGGEPADSGSPDSGQADAGDAGSTDAGSPDAGFVDVPPTGRCTPLSDAGWSISCWENPWPQGNRIESIWASPGSANAWFVTSNAGIFQSLSDGGYQFHVTAAAVDTPTTDPSLRYRAVCGTSDKDVYVAGDGHVLHFDGGTWTELDNPGSNSNFAMDCTGGDVWVAQRADSVFHLVNGTWTPDPPDAGDPSPAGKMWRSPAGDLYVTALYGAYRRPASGGPWQRIPLPAAVGGNPYTAVWGHTDSDVLFGGSNFGEVFRYDGGFTAEQTPQVSTVTAIHGVGDDEWAVGAAGGVLHHKDSMPAGSPWAFEQVGFDDLSSVFAVSTKDAWTGGRLGRLFRFDGSTWQDVAPGFRVQDVHRLSATTAGNAWAVTFIAVLRRVGDRWVEQTPPNSGVYWHDVHTFSPTDTWAVGTGGTIAHWNGSAWATVNSSVVKDLNGVWGAAPDDVWAVGVGGTIVHWDGSAWTPIPSPTTEDLNDVDGSGPHNVWATGSAATVLRGPEWTQLPAPASAATNLISVTVLPDQAVAVGSGLFRYDASGWKDIAPNNGSNVSALLLPNGDVMTGGPGGVLLIRDAVTKTWIPHTPGAYSGFQSFARTTEGDVFVAGDNGAILHLRR